MLLRVIRNPGGPDNLERRKLEGKGERESKEKLGRAAAREGGPGSVGARVRQREAV